MHPNFQKTTKLRTQCHKSQYKIQEIFIKSNYIIKQSYDYVHSISPPFLNIMTESHHSRGSSEHRDDGIKVHFLIFFMGILFLEFCPIFEAFSWAMTNTVIADNVKALHQGPTQSCSCLALAHIKYSRAAQRTLFFSIKAK